MSEHLDAYATAQAQQGYGRHSIRQHIVVLADFSRWLKQKQIAIQNLDTSVVDRFLRLRRRQERVRRGDPLALARMLNMLYQIDIVKPCDKPASDNACSRMVEEFRCYLLQERGLSTATLRNYLACT